MKVNTEDAVGGTTTEDILNENDGIVLPAGVLLSEPLIKALVNQNIHQVDVAFGEDEATERPATVTNQSELSKRDQELKDHIDQLFLRHRGQFMKEFQQCLLQIENLSS